MILLTGQKIQFKYKGGRQVRCTIVGTFLDKQITGVLHTDYKGKNEEWFSGERKSFNVNEMKNVQIISQP
jgi:uncharacterized protein with ATP-grasp and redox domains